MLSSIPQNQGDKREHDSLKYTLSKAWSKLWAKLCAKNPQNRLEPLIIARHSHGISRKNLSSYVIKVLYTLHNAGYKAYLVGGGVRDLLLKAHPKDFDVATNARPEQIRTLFRNCRLIGRRFRLAHIYFGSHFVEVATFRGETTENAEHRVHSEEGMILKDNSYGTLEDDVFRRDFTINALYYNIADFSLIDYVGGLKDLELRCVRVIGDPKTRFREDPLRMLRALRFAAKLNFNLSVDSESVIRESADCLKQIHSSRLLDECLKLFLSGFGLKSFRLLRHYHLFEVLFPGLAQALKETKDPQAIAFIEGALNDTDERVEADRPVTFSFLLAAFLWIPLQNSRLDFQDAAEAALQDQHRHTPLPKRLQQSILDIWYLQGRFNKKGGKRVLRFFAHPQFRAGIDLLMLRATHSSDHRLKEQAHWWQNCMKERANESV